MVVGNGEELLKKLMKVQGKCPNCATTLTFEDSARLGRDHGVSENAIMCPNCRKVFNVNITPDKMEILDELTKYNFSAKIKKDETNPGVGAVVKQETKPEAKKEIETQKSIKQTSSVKPIDSKVNSARQQAQTGTKSKRTLFDVLENNSLIQKLFFKTDAEYGLLRPSKARILTTLWFILLFSLSLISLYGSYGYLDFTDFINSVFGALLYTIPVFIVAWLIARHLDGKVTPNPQLDSLYKEINDSGKSSNVENATPEPDTHVKDVVDESVVDETIEESVEEVEDTIDAKFAKKPVDEVEEAVVDEPVDEVEDAVDENQYFEKDNAGTCHDTVSKANAYWLGERLAKEEKDPFTLYMFTSAADAEKALLELPYIHKASDTGKLICDDVLIYGYYEVGRDNYEAIICGKGLTPEQFKQAEDSFDKHGGKLKNNLEPAGSVKEVETPEKTESSVKFREIFSKNQYTYECYDADSKSDAIEFLKGKTVNERLYYICVYTPEGDFGRDIDGLYQM